MRRYKLIRDVLEGTGKTGAFLVKSRPCVKRIQLQYLATNLKHLFWLTVIHHTVCLAMTAYSPVDLSLGFKVFLTC